MSHIPRSRRVALAILAALPLVLGACQSTEEKRMKAIAGTYAMAFREPLQRGMQWSDTLVLRADGKWVRGGFVKSGKFRHSFGPDSGAYAVDGVKVKVVVRDPEGTVVRNYTISGDTLYSADAAMMQQITGIDVGEQFMVRRQ